MASNKHKISGTGGYKKVLGKMEVNFTQVANSVLQDPRLSLRAKGLYALMYGKPTGWNFSAERIAEETKEGKDTIQGAMRALIMAGYMTRKKLSSGRMLYELSYPIVKLKMEKLPSTRSEEDRKLFESCLPECFK